MSADIEQGLDLKLDFTKLQSVAATGHLVVPVVLQHVDTGEVLFVGYANDQALQATRDEGRAVLWSTSRNELWRKGETSGDVLSLIEVRVNCEQNSLLYVVRPVNSGVCHTKDHSGANRESCYYRRLDDGDTLVFTSQASDEATA